MSAAPSKQSLGRLIRAVDFERVLRTRRRVESLHFAVHHLGEKPSGPGKARRGLASPQLSTEEAEIAMPAVEGFEPVVVGTPLATSQPLCPTGLVDTVWLGIVLPKRHARRAVTRSLLKRQIRVAVDARVKSLAAGLWVVRLRSPFDRTVYPSAASPALRRAARAELEDLFLRCSPDCIPRCAALDAPRAVR